MPTSVTSFPYIKPSQCEFANQFLSPVKSKCFTEIKNSFSMKYTHADLMIHSTHSDVWIVCALKMYIKLNTPVFSSSYFSEPLTSLRSSYGREIQDRNYVWLCFASVFGWRRIREKISTDVMLHVWTEKMYFLFGNLFHPT